MNKKKKLIRNILIIGILYYILVKAYGFYFTPLGAHRNSERTIHYGPSRTIHIEDYERGKYILGKYDKWFSCSTVNRHLFFHWNIGSGVSGIENDLSEPVSYTWSASGDYYKVYGVINDSNIVKIEVTLDNGDILEQIEFHEDMFLIHWNGQWDRGKDLGRLRAYDKDNNIIFEMER